MHSYESVDYKIDIPVYCKTGPLRERTCNDVLCSLFYLVLLGGVIFLGIFCASANGLSESKVESELKNESYGKPLLAIAASAQEIVLSLLCVIALCLVMVITTFIVPTLAAYLFIPLFMILMLLVGAGFLYRYFGQTLPFISKSVQTYVAQDHSWLALGVGSLFILGFLISLIVVLTKKEKFKNIVPVLRLAKLCFWQNSYMFIISFILSALSISALYMNLRILEIALDSVDSQHYIDRRIMALLVIVEAVWTHGMMEALSDFVFQSIAIHWYFNEKKLGKDYGKISNNLCPTLALTVKHIGTIIFGHVLAYIPESINLILNRCQTSCKGCYDFCCVFHRCTFKDLSKYCYSKTVLQSKSFCEANNEMSYVRVKTKSVLPYLYMMGNFYITLAKIFIVMFSLVICYLLLLPHVSNSNDLIYLIAPLLITFFGSIEIANHFMDSTGLVGDTIVFMYVVDLEIEKKYYRQMEPYSCPQDAYDIIHRSRAGDPYENE